jgi:hypothetical protein
MKYAITAVGVSRFIDISKEEFDRLIEIRRNLLVVLAVEEKFDLLLENHAEFELALLELSVRKLIFHEDQAALATAHRTMINRRVANLLSSACLYRDQTKHDIASIYHKGSAQTESLEESFSDQYHASLGYRAMEGLRNHVQHRGLPVHRLMPSSERERAGPNSLLSVAVRPFVKVQRLKDDPKIKPAVLRELNAIKDDQGYVDLTQLAREYVEGLGRVHKSTRALIAAEVGKWDAELLSVLERARQELGHAAGVSAVAANDQHQILEAADVFPEIIDRRKALERKNRNLGILSGRYVTSRAKLES